jgi:hypothetical protein
MDGQVMKREDVNGYFTKSLFSLQLQIKTLLDGAGGEETGHFLDTLTEMSQSEQSVALRVFQRALDKFRASGLRLQSVDDEHQMAFENALYEELVEGIAALDSSTLERGLHVVDGGKLPTRQKREKRPICLSTARQKRAEGRTTL